MESTIGKLYTPSEVAEMLGVTHEAVLRWLRSGKLGGHKLGDDSTKARWRITSRQISDFLPAYRVASNRIE